jgi:hypothetical protein
MIEKESATMCNEISGKEPAHYPFGNIKRNVGEKIIDIVGERTKEPAVHICIPVKEVENYRGKHKQGNIFQRLPLSFI